MPAAPRPKGVAKKIFYRVMGKPKNETKPKDDQKQSNINKRLVFEETSQVR